jgi:hypothetical protein
MDFNESLRYEDLVRELVGYGLPHDQAVAKARLQILQSRDTPDGFSPRDPKNKNDGARPLAGSLGAMVDHAGNIDPHNITRRK